MLYYMVFVYGTMMDSHIRYLAIGDNPTITSFGVLPEYKEIFIIKDGTNYHTIIPDPLEAVVGEVLLLTPDQLNRLDAWEEKYSRQPLKLHDGREVWVYILKG